MDIGEGGLNKLIQIYKDALPEVRWSRCFDVIAAVVAAVVCIWLCVLTQHVSTNTRHKHTNATTQQQLGGYLTDAGDLHHGRLELMLSRLADLEVATLRERAEETEHFESRRQRRGGRGGFGGGGGDGRPASGNGGGGAARAAAAQPPPAADFSSFGALASGADALLDPLAGAAGALAAADADGDALEAADDAAAEAEAAKNEPTMMSKEARNLFLNGEGEAALEAWKVRRPPPPPHPPVCSF